MDRRDKKILNNLGITEKKLKKQLSGMSKCLSDIRISCNEIQEKMNNGLDDSIYSDIKKLKAGVNTIEKQLKQKQRKINKLSDDKKHIMDDLAEKYNYKEIIEAAENKNRKFKRLI